LLGFYLKQALIRFFKNHGYLRACALAYSLVMALVPLFASFSLLTERLYLLYKEKIDVFMNLQEINSLIVRFLPFNNQELDNYIQTFVNNAQTIGKMGLIVLIITVYFLFETIEEVFNITWELPKNRPFLRKLMVYFGIAFVFSIAFSGSVLLTYSEALKQYVYFRIPGQILVVLFSVGGFTLLYIAIPYTTVKFGAALWGGIFTTFLYESGKIFFLFFVKLAVNYSKIYGSLSIIPFFIISILMFAFIILIGMELTFIFQNRQTLFAEQISQFKRRRREKSTRKENPKNTGFTIPRRV